MVVDMAKVTIEIDRSKLPDHTDDQFEEWINFSVGALGGIVIKNPLHDQDLSATVLEWEQ